MSGLKPTILILLCIACIEPYTPQIPATSQNSLVVDGSIGTDGSATVRLSRSIPLNSNSYTPSERGATITIESSHGETFSLTEGDSALYTATGLAVGIGNTYTLHIRTADGNEYQSGDVSIYPTPPIDDVYFDVAPTGDALEVYLDAHDDNPNATGYYIWDCIETFEYHAAINSGYKFVNKQPIIRHPSEQVYTCWRDDIKPSVMATTNSLSEHTIKGQPIVNIPKTSVKISVRYSILVKQRSISEEEYSYRIQLQKSTEQQGSLFAAIPGPVLSNVRSLSDPGEYVLGYFRGQQVQQQRFFIERTDLPEDFRVNQPQGDCQSEATCRTDQPLTGTHTCVDVYVLGDEAMITGIITNDVGVVVSYYFTTNACADCTLRGGNTTPPPYW